jgi:hypothetical protein
VRDERASEAGLLTRASPDDHPLALARASIQDFSQMVVKLVPMLPSRCPGRLCLQLRGNANRENQREDKSQISSTDRLHSTLFPFGRLLRITNMASECLPARLRPHSRAFGAGGESNERSAA